MRYLILAVALVFAAQVRAMPVVSLAPSTTEVVFSQAFTVDVVLSGVMPADPLLAFGFDVTPRAGLRFDGAAVAPPLADDSALFAETDVAGSVFPAVFGDDILLATLQFTAGLAEGSWDIMIGTSAAALGVSQGLFTVFDTVDLAGTVSVEVSEAAAIPVAGTLPLFLLGLAGALGTALPRSPSKRSPSRRPRVPQV